MPRAASPSRCAVRSCSSVDTLAYPISSPDMTNPRWGEVDPLPGGTGIDDGTSPPPASVRLCKTFVYRLLVEVNWSEEALEHLARSQRYSGAADIEVDWTVEAVNDSAAVQVDPYWTSRVNALA